MTPAQPDSILSGSWLSSRKDLSSTTMVQSELVMGDVHDDLERDPVSHDRVDSESARWHSSYNGKLYHFTTRESKKIFEEDPQLWISTPHASVNSAALEPVNDER